MSLHILSTQERWDILQKHNPHAKEAKSILYDKTTQENDSKNIYFHHIESFIGTVKVSFLFLSYTIINNKYF